MNVKQRWNILPFNFLSHILGQSLGSILLEGLAALIEKKNLSFNNNIICLMQYICSYL